MSRMSTGGKSPSKDPPSRLEISLPSTTDDSSLSDDSDSDESLVDVGGGPHQQEQISDVRLDKRFRSISKAAGGSRLTIPEGSCVFCGRSEEDNGTVFGSLKFTAKDGIIAHELCLYAAPKLVQDPTLRKRSTREAPLMGFNPSEIYKEFARGSRLVCCFCKKRGATVGCSKEDCKLGFHFPCGHGVQETVGGRTVWRRRTVAEGGTVHQFNGSYPSWCSKHAPEPPRTGERRKIATKKAGNGRRRFICYRPVTCGMYCGEETKVNTCPSTCEVVETICCKARNGEVVPRYYHYDCIQQYALSQGHYKLKCPHCANKREFRKQLAAAFVYIPIRDAAYVSAENSFYRVEGDGETYCEAKEDCKYPAGYKSCIQQSPDVNSFPPGELLHCSACGRTFHRCCAGPPYDDPEADLHEEDFSCVVCRRAVASTPVADVILDEVEEAVCPLFPVVERKENGEAPSSPTRRPAKRGGASRNSSAGPPSSRRPDRIRRADTGPTRPVEGLEERPSSSRNGTPGVIPSSPKKGSEASSVRTSPRKLGKQASLDAKQMKLDVFFQRNGRD